MENMQQKFYRLSKSFTDNNMLPIETNPYSLSHVNPELDWYTSLYTYNNSHLDKWKQTKSFSGMDGVTTNQIFFDFDYKDDLEKARQDTIEVISRITQYNVDLSAIQICFSGQKGFSVRIKTNQEFTPTELKTLTQKLAKNIPSYDPIVYDNQRIIRMIGTRHQKSGLYKLPISIKELEDLSIDDIKALASDKAIAKERTDSFSWPTVDLPEKIYSMRIPKAEPKKERKDIVVDIDESLSQLNLSDRPRWMPACKFALQEGFFEEGHRREAIMILGATYRAQGFHGDIIYRMLKGVAEKQAEVNNCDRFADEEVYRVAEQVTGERWKGGQYTCKTHPILKDICDKLGKHSCAALPVEEDYKPISIIDIKDSFKDYVINIDKNTIKTGIPTIDDNVFISTGVNMGIIGAAGSGKTSLALNILNNTSKAGVQSVFASLDMHKNRMFEKVLYKVSGMQRENLYDIFKNNKEEELMAKIEQEFGNVNFFNKSSPSVADLRKYILNCQESSGEKVKLVMLDYFERVNSDVGDDTAASKRVAGELQDLVNDLDIALITLVQPNKMGIAGGAETPLYNYTSIKGSSFVYQAFRIIMSLWRPFYNPKDHSNDRFMQMAVLKNDLGELNEFAFGWDGPRGEIYEMDNPGHNELQSLLSQRAEETKGNNNGW